MTAKAKQEDALSILMVAKWEESGQKLEKLAAEFPDGKFEHRPVEGLRTFGEGGSGIWCSGTSMSRIP